MLTRLKHAALVTGALLLPVTSAHAQFLSGGTVSGCGGNNFIACATWSAMATGDTLVFTITNNSNLAPANNSSVFTEIGFGNVGVSDPATGHFSSTGYGSWSLDTGLTGFNGFGLVQNTFGANSDPGNLSTQGLATGQTTTFKFWWDTPFNTSAFDSAQVAIHAQGGPNSCSTKAVFNGTTGANIGDSTVSESCGGSTVPEPSSVMLLGSAMMGLAGTGFIRRRRR